MVATVRNVVSPAQAGHYYEVSDYYVNGQAPSEWWGKGASGLGLEGGVDKKVFEKILVGELPDGTKLPLGRPTDKGRERRPGVDVQFAAPKSISIQALVGGDKRLFAAHEAAVTRALEWLEENAAQIRVTRDGVLHRENTGNLVVARYQHPTSRELDPQLHTHAIVLSASKSSEGKWRALANEEFYRAKMFVGAIYHNELAREVRALGYTITPTGKNGVFELEGYDRDKHIMPFSQRRAQVLEAAEKLRQDPRNADLGEAELNAKAAVRSRRAKQVVPMETLRATWSERARELGANVIAQELSALAAKQDLSQGPERGRPGLSQAQVVDPKTLEAVRDAVIFAVDHLGERSAVLAEMDVQRTALQRLAGCAGLLEVNAAIAALEKTGSLQRTPTGDLAPFPALVSERQSLDLVAKGHAATQPILPSAALGLLLPGVEADLGGIKLNPGQREAVVGIISGKDTVVGVEGYAGTGKTTMLQVVRRFAEDAGYEVRGAAPTARAARVLETETGIGSTTVHRHLQASAHDEPGDRPQLWVIDEASLLGNQLAHRLLKTADRVGARVVFLGDRLQLPAIEAGRPFALYIDHGMQTATMAEIRRQDPERAPEPLKESTRQLKTAIEQTIAGDVAGAVATLKPAIFAVEDRKDRLQQTAQAYLALSPQDRGQSLVLTGSNNDRAAINALIRAGLEVEGVLTGPTARVDILVRRDLTRAELREAKTHAAGDVIRFGRDYKEMGTKNGEYLTVTAIDPKARLVHLRDERGQSVAWTPHLHVKAESFRIEQRELRAGDEIRWTRNDAVNQRRNSEVAKVLTVDAGRRQARVLYENREQTLDLATERHWEHGYTSTVHAAQGRTVDRVIAHIDTKVEKLVGRESWYVAISRARHTVQVFTNDAARLPQAISESRTQRSAVQSFSPSPPSRAQAPVTQEKAAPHLVPPLPPRGKSVAQEPVNAVSLPSALSQGGAAPAGTGPSSISPSESALARPDLPAAWRWTGSTPTDRTTRAVIKQLESMGAATYDVGVLELKTKKMINRWGWTPEQVVNGIGFLKAMNSQGKHIYIRPAGEWRHLTLVDDLSKEALTRMKQEGYQPAAVVQTSPNNYQAWLRHDRMVSTETATRMAKSLVERFGGDKDAACWRQYGRLAGFTNTKDKYLGARKDGLFPYSLLTESSGQSYGQAKTFVEDTERALKDEERQRLERLARVKIPRDVLLNLEHQSRGVRPISEYHDNPRYGGDLHTADMAWARHAANQGLSRDEIASAIVDGRDLTKKGNAEQQLKYAYRTAERALDPSAGRTPPSPGYTLEHTHVHRC